MTILASLFLVATVATLMAAADDDVCISETNTYTTRVNLYAGEFGYDIGKCKYRLFFCRYPYTAYPSSLSEGISHLTSVLP
jgi:hypothetical protein